MKTFLIYFFFFSFWAENVLEIKLSKLQGLSLQNLSIYLLLFAWGFMALKKKVLFERNNVNIFLILMMLVVMGSIPIKMSLAEIPNISFFREIMDAKNWFNPFFLFFITFNIIDDEKGCKYALLGLVILLVTTVLSSILISYGGIEFGTLHTRRDSRFSGFANPNEYAAYLVFFLPLLLSFLLLSRNLIVKVMYSILILLPIFLVLLLTGSRSGAIALLFCVAVYLMMLNQQKILRFRTIIILAVVLVMICFTSYVISPPQFKQKVFSRFDPSHSEDMYEFTSGRTMLFGLGLKLFLESPIFGHGQKTSELLLTKKFGVIAVTHNQYLEILVQFGIIGFFIFIIVWLKVFQHVYYHYKNCTDPWAKKLYLSYIAGFSGYAISMLGNTMHWSRYLFWIYTAIVYRYSQLEEKNFLIKADSQKD